jgi:hypothetical protein
MDIPDMNLFERLLSYPISCGGKPKELIDFSYWIKTTQGRLNQHLRLGLTRVLIIVMTSLFLLVERWNSDVKVLC